MRSRIRNTVATESGPIHTGSGNTCYGYLANSSCDLSGGRKDSAFGRDDLSPSCIARFHDKYKQSEGCWLWTGSKFPKGYGQVCIGRHEDGRQINSYAHRVAYVLAKGAIPKGKVVMHSCDVPACVNPEHLVLGTQADNVADAKQKGHYKGHPNLWHRKLSDADVRDIRTSPEKSVELARRYGVSRPCISQIRRGLRRKAA